ncbi:MAG: serine protease [Candidatus Omnitrophica bacterium]|nr:serine protease [Candidatus Omnitrophota bacterium]
MNKFKYLCVFVAVIGVLFSQVDMRADDKEEEVLRSVQAKYQDTVLAVKYVLKMSSALSGQGGMPEEQKGESAGTVIDSSGLLVISNTELRGAAAIFDMMDTSSMGGKMDISVVPSDFKVVMPNGSELPAKLVAQDSDLDLAFIRIESKEKLALNVVPFVKNSAANIGDIVITIGRLSENLNREPLSYHNQVISIIRKPRVMYMVTGLGNTGCPVFNMDSKAIGILLMRPSSVKRNPMMFMNMSASNSLEFMPLILPADVILDAVAKLPPPSAPAEEKKAE